MDLLQSLLFMLNEMSPYILLGFLIAGVLHAFVPESSVARHLSGTGWRSVVKAALIGVPLPLCSCGVLPTAIALRRGGASRAATTSFLVATPQTGVDSIAATWSLLGPAFAIVRPVAAMVTALFGGRAVGMAESATGATPAATACETAPHSHSHDGHRHPGPGATGRFGSRCVSALRYGFIDLVGSIGSWLVAGLLIAALITVYLPENFFVSLGASPVVTMLAVLVVAVPMYVCATGSIPIAMSLMLKGLSPGTALVLLMAGPAANFASFTLISREMGVRQAIIYLGSIVLGAIGFGLLIDYVLPVGWFDLAAVHPAGCCHHESAGLFPTLCTAVLVALLLYTFAKRIFSPKTQFTTDMTKEYTIVGMNCPHCQATVTKSIAAVAGVEQVDVNLKSGVATVEGNAAPELIVAAVREAGFDVK